MGLGKMKRKCLNIMAQVVYAKHNLPRLSQLLY